MLYIVKHGSWIVSGQFLSSIFSLGLIIAFANLLPKETYGTYRYILSIAAILNVFALSGMNAAVSRITAKGDIGVLRPAVKYQLIWNLGMMISFGVLSGYYFINDDSLFGISFLILGLFVPATLAFNTYGAFLEGKKEFGRANLLSVLSTAIYSGGTFLTLFFIQEVVWLIAVYALTTFIPSVIFYLYTVRKFKLPTSTDIKDTLAYSRELSYLRIVDPVVSQIDKVLLAHFWGPAQLAMYSLALAIPNRAVIFLKGWLAIGFPKFSEKSPAEINQMFWRRIWQGVALGCCASLAYVALAPLLFTYVLPQYIDAIFYSQLLSLNLIFALPNRYVSLLFTSQRMSRILYVRTFIQNVLLVILYVIAGVWGGLLWLIIVNILNSFLGAILNVSLWLMTSKKTDHFENNSN